jgi:hypothetical protein
MSILHWEGGDNLDAATCRFCQKRLPQISFRSALGWLPLLVSIRDYSLSEAVGESTLVPQLERRISLIEVYKHLFDLKYQRIRPIML